MRSNEPRSGFSSLLISLAVVGVILVGLGAGWYYLYRHRDAQPTPPTTSAGNITPGNGSSGQMPSGTPTRSDGSQTMGGSTLNGTITAVSASSITIRTSDGQTRTYGITSSTSVTDASAQTFGNAGSGEGSYQSLHVGDKVAVTPSQSDASSAMGILFNLR